MRVKVKVKALFGGGKVRQKTRKKIDIILIILII